MAVVNPIYMAQYNNLSAPGNIIEITNGGTNSLSTHEQVQALSTIYSSRWAGFQWGGNVYLPIGSKQTSSFGVIKYNPRLGKFDFSSHSSIAPPTWRVPVGDRVACCGNNYFWSGPSPDWNDYLSGAITTLSKNMICINGETVHFATAPNSNRHYTWTYPFTSQPAEATVQPALDNLATYLGEVYGVIVNTTTSYLYKWSGSSFSLVGSGFALDDASYVGAALENSVLFEWHDKLWLVVNYINALATQTIRCYEVNVSTGGVTERNTYVPSAWKVAPTDANVDIFSVVDDASSSSRKVFIVKHKAASGTWEMYEFDGDEGTWDSIASGSEAILPGGIVWDSTKGQAGSVIGMTDSSPSSHAALDLKVADLINNNDVDLEINYLDLTLPNGSMAPPYDVCTGYGGSSMTSLESSPSTPSLAGLSDDFADSSIDDDLWHIGYCGYAYNLSPYRDLGGEYGIANRKFKINETAGRIAIGSSLDRTGLTYTGAALRGKWAMQGAFQADFTLDALANLRNGAGWLYWIGAMIKVGTNKGYAFFVANNSGTIQAKGAFFKADTITVYSVSTPTVADDDVIRIARDGADAWTLTYDPGGGGEADITPVGDDYDEDVNIWLIGGSGSATAWATAEFGPGFSDLDVSGAGSVGLWEPGQGYDKSFDWDHVTDLGTGFNGGVQIITRLG